MTVARRKTGELELLDPSARGQTAAAAAAVERKRARCRHSRTPTPRTTILPLPERKRILAVTRGLLLSLSLSPCSSRLANFCSLTGHRAARAAGLSIYRAVTSISIHCFYDIVFR